MSQNVQVVSSPVIDPRLPEVLAPAAAFLKRAEADGVLAGCEESFVMGRRNGHTGAGISVFLLTYLLVHPSTGLRKTMTGAMRRRSIIWKTKVPTPRYNWKTPIGSRLTNKTCTAPSLSWMSVRRKSWTDAG